MTSYFRPFHFSGRTNKPQSRPHKQAEDPLMWRNWWVAQLLLNQAPSGPFPRAPCPSRVAPEAELLLGRFGVMEQQAWRGSTFTLLDKPSRDRSQLWTGPENWDLGIPECYLSGHTVACCVAPTSFFMPISSQGTRHICWKFTHILTLSNGVSCKT